MNPGKKLQLSLRKIWFEMTKKGVKTEDYREINPYWCAQFLLYDGENKKRSFWREYVGDIEIDPRISFRIFSENIMTLGYPKSTDVDRILRYENLGIKIGPGKTEWGADEGVKYFIIKHGLRL